MSTPSRRQAAPPLDLPAARLISVAGAVQGVGFRPFVHGLATSLGLAGEVRNTSRGVEIEIEGRAEDVELFLRRLVDEAPPLSLVESVSAEASRPHGCHDFVIGHSEERAGISALVTADAATCDDCLNELFDPADRRFHYPFINCTNCGPRFTITMTVPYDRANTTMAGFVMCAACTAEYEDPADRRFHAQPNACPDCGPSLEFAGSRGAHATVSTSDSDGALSAALHLLHDGGTLAIKGLGGYHLACDATDPDAVSTLRARKHRDEKPFAVMMADIAQVLEYCALSEGELRMLTSTRRPIVLLDRRADGGDLAPAVAPGVTTHGVFLPYTPLHHLLLRAFSRPLVMTSGNVSDEPIAYRDDDARGRLAPLADGFLTHDRPIHMRTDDSVVRSFRGGVYPLRRARGYAPLPVRFSGSDAQILAVGAHLKNTFCLTKGNRAFLSHHIGDLENLQTLRALAEGVTHLRRLFGLQPEVLAHDLHPDYLSSRYARGYAREHGVPLVAVQHHEAHVASVVAETGYTDTVVGVAFDGAGLGSDGNIWGGEFFAGTPGRFTRAAHFGLQPLPGGDSAVREPWRLAVAQLAAGTSIGSEIESAADVPPIDPGHLTRVLAALPEGERFAEYPWAVVLEAARRQVNTPMTSSVGRLFDTVAAVLGIRHTVTYEGQAAILLEAAARRSWQVYGFPAPSQTPPWAVPVGSAVRSPGSGAGPRVIPITPFVDALLADLHHGLPPSRIAARFHETLAAVTADTAIWAAEQYAAGAVALGGGVFQNLALLELVAGRLESVGLRVLTHATVPTNDGGLSLGQAETLSALARRGALNPRAEDR